jgi:DNA replication protein DnaC
MGRKSPTRESVRQLLQALRLLGAANALDSELDRAESEGTAHMEFLTRLMEYEAAYQRERSLAYRVKSANLPWPWTLDSFPFDKQPGVSKSQILTLAGLDFVKRSENLLIYGNTGVGKSGIAIGLCREACLNGYRSVFYNAQVLLDQLYASLADRSTSRLIKTLARVPLLAIDELSYMTLKPEQCNAFFRLMDQRYNRTSTIITSNLEPGEWHTMFQNRTLLDALVDRLQHHCIKIHIKGPSLRTPATKESPPTRAAVPMTSKTPKSSKNSKKSSGTDSNT